MQNYTNTDLLNLKGVVVDSVASFEDHIDVKIHSLYKEELMLWQDKEIKEAYLLKESFYDVLDASSKEEARQALDKWLWVAKESGLKEFKASIRAYENWKEEILNAFSTGITNGQTEGFNNKIKVIKRVSYGYRNFENFKSRILMVFRA